MNTIQAFMTTIGLICTALNQLLFPEPSLALVQSSEIVQEEFSYEEEQAGADQYVVEASETETESETEAETQPETEVETEDLRLKRSAIYNKYQEYKEKYNEIYGWLSIKSLGIEYPIAYRTPLKKWS